MLDQILANADLFFIIAARIIALIETAPLLSGDGVSQTAKIGLGAFAAAAVYPWVKESGYPIPADLASYLGIIVGEVLIGIIMGFFLSLVYSAFTTAGQFFSLQMGFGASETYDPLAQLEIPVVGQFLNLIAMFVFISTSGFQKLFLIGVRGSFMSIRAADLLVRKDDFFEYISLSLGSLFANALVLSFPVFGTLLLVSVGLGLLAKAAPQMNLLSEGFPVSILTAFLLMAFAMPFMIESFSALIDSSYILIKTITGAPS